MVRVGGLALRNCRPLSLLLAAFAAASCLSTGCSQPASTRSYTSVSAIESLVVEAEAAERGEYSAVPEGVAQPWQLLPPATGIGPGWSMPLADAATWLDEHYQAYPDDVSALILRARLGRLQRMSRGVDPPTREELAEEYAPLHARLERALALEPENPEAHYWKARLYGVHIVREGKSEYVFDDLDEAIRFARDAVRLSPDNVIYREALAIFLVEDAQLDPAIAVMRDVDNGRHPIFLLLTDLQAVPVPEQAVFSAEYTQGMRYWMEWVGEILYYPELRFRVYVVPLTKEEVEAFYRERWPDFRFLIGQEDDERSSPRMYVQALRWEDGVHRLAPTWATWDEFALDGNANLDAIALVLLEISGPNAAERQQRPTAVDGVERMLIIHNLREPEPP